MFIVNPSISTSSSNLKPKDDLIDHLVTHQLSPNSKLNRSIILLTSLLASSCAIPKSWSNINAGKPTLVIVDHFKIPPGTTTSERLENSTEHLIDLDQDANNDISHGDLVTAIAKAKGAKCLILDGGACRIKDIPPQATVVNISLSVNLSFKEISERIGLHVTPQNIKSIRAEVLDRLEALPMTELHYPESIADAVKNVRHLEALARRGVVPVVAAGNMGTETLNLLTLGAGTVVVGGLDENGNKHELSGNNSLVSEWRPFSIQPQVVSGGISLQNNQQIDFKWSKTSTKGKFMELSVAPKEILETAQIACEQLTLSFFAKHYQKLGLPSGIYHPTSIIFDSKVVERKQSTIFINPTKYSDDYCLIAFKNSDTPHIWVLTGNLKTKVPLKDIKYVDAEVQVQIENKKENISLSEKELAKILIQAGLKDGNYDLQSIKKSLEDNTKKRVIKIHLTHNALILKGNKFSFANIRNQQLEVIEGTSVATPVVSAEIIQQKSGSR